MITVVFTIAHWLFTDPDQLKEVDTKTKSKIPGAAAGKDDDSDREFGDQAVNNLDATFSKPL